jgi:putative membrane protein insertion efficiency factor
MMAVSINRVLVSPILALIWVYSNAISPWLGTNCRFQPTCSSYASEALIRFGLLRGGAMALKRIRRCHPWGGSGYDPVPEQTDGRDEAV